MQTSPLQIGPMVDRVSTPFPELVERHKGLVYRVCRHMLGDSHEAEDAAQATFLILFLRMKSIRETDHIDRWLSGVARRVALRARRRNVRREHRERLWAEARADYVTDEDEQRLSEIKRLIRAELSRLPDRDRQPLVLCYLNGLTHEEAARRLGCPLGTIKARLVRARRKLKDRLSRRGVALSVALLIWLLGWDRSVILADDQPSKPEQVGPSPRPRIRSTPRGNSAATTAEVIFMSAEPWMTMNFRAILCWSLAIVAASTLFWSSYRLQQNRRTDAMAAARAAKVLDANCNKPATSTLIATSR